MQLEDILRSRALRASARSRPLGPHIDAIVAHAATIGYTPSSLHDLLSGVIHFGRYLAKHGVVDLRDLRSSHVEALVAGHPLTRCRGQYWYPISREIRGARHLLRYTQATGLAPLQPTPRPCYPAVLEEWLAFLTHHRGLSPKSLELYARHVQRFLAELGPAVTPEGLRALDAIRIRTYINRAVAGWSRSESSAVASTIRLFLRYAWERGYLARDLSLAVERVPKFKHDRLPRGPRWEDAQRLLEAPDRATPLGRRDYAILQLLLTYGVRAQQVCRLKLDDLDWRHATVCFLPLKGGRPVEVPLLTPFGDAVLAYLREGRPASPNRQVFLSSRPPFRMLTTSAITGLVARAFVRTGVPSPHHGSHALRHAWATRLLAKGQSIKTIADLLGHRSLETTRIYAKVDFVRLRTVGLSWPKGGQP